jgi:glutamate/tyrosine decarboxylase-like PLP-dependent enzyme
MKNKPFTGSGIIKKVKKLEASKCSQELNRAPASGLAVDLSRDGDRQVAAWFLGPRAENLDMFIKLVEEAITDHAYWRRNFHPEDPVVITDAIQRETGYLDMVARTKSELFKLLAQLKGSVPFSSMRYQGHMSWDQTIPGMVAYVAGMLYNQNNTATEASPVTTILEYLVGQDLCRMFGYQTEGNTGAWGHLTCGGTTANIEALWAARNAKYYPVAIKKAIDEASDASEDTLPEKTKALIVTLPDATKKRIIDLNSWELLNITLDETLALPDRVVALITSPNPSPEELKQAQDLLKKCTEDYLLQNAGLLGLYTNELLPPLNGTVPIKPPIYFVPASKHYSLPKGAAILGVGGNNLRAIPLDKYGRMDTDVLKNELAACRENFEPVISVTAVFGTTEEGNVDPLKEILTIRAEMRNNGFDFATHADCAWGGYFAAMLPRPEPKIAEPPAESGPVPVLPMSTYVYEQYEQLKYADTITVDPHKTGYIPYPAGAFCYRNKLMRNLVAFSAPYTNTSSTGNGSNDEQPCQPNTEPDYPEEDLVMGLYGIEGSKPGAAAAGVYLSQAVIPTDPSGYGTLLGRTLFNCKMFHLALLALNQESHEFRVEPVPHTHIAPAELRALHEKPYYYNDFIQDPKKMAILKEQGADLNIICFAFNFKHADGTWNTSLTAANTFNDQIFERCGVKLHDNIHDYRFVTSATKFPRYGYGDLFFNDYAARLLKLPETTEWDSDSIRVMRSVIMDPWLTESRDGQPFLKEVVAELGYIVCEVLRDMRKGMK